jgi:adenylate cyclase
LSWMRGQIASGISEEIEPREPGDRWFRHIPTGSLWRLGPIDSSSGPGFWPAQDKQRVQRRLAAILAADVVGYSALMERAEEATYAEFERLKRELIEPCLSRHEGRLIKTTGDGALAEFASPLAAVRCAVEIQDHLASGSSLLRLRIGLNLGDVIVGQDGDLYGDGTNIAVRLEGIADPGGVLISEKVYNEVEGKLDVGFEDRGEQQLKNISKPVRAYAVHAGAYSALIERLTAAPPLPDKPSIAVLPFENMSGDPEQEYFADGVVEDIITALSRFKSLFVIARNSTFTYKGKAVDIKRVGRDLGVRYVVEGSVRKAAARMRINCQLIDASSGVHIWAEKFDEPLKDMFELQDKLTEQLVGQIAPQIDQAELELARHKPTENLDAYDFLMRGRALDRLYRREDNQEALKLFYRAIELDPSMALAYSAAAMSYSDRKNNGWMEDEEKETLEARRLVKAGLKFGQNDAECLAKCALVYSFIFMQNAISDNLIERALALNPNLSFAWLTRGAVSIYLGDHKAGLEALEHAIRLNPLDPVGTRGANGIRAIALFHLDRYDEACSVAASVHQAIPSCATMLRVQAAAHALAGRLEIAQSIMSQHTKQIPTLRPSNFRQFFPFERAADLERMERAFRLAGMPE